MSSNISANNVLVPRMTTRSSPQDDQNPSEDFTETMEESTTDPQQIPMISMSMEEFNARIAEALATEPRIPMTSSSRIQTNVTTPSRSSRFNLLNEGTYDLPLPAAPLQPPMQAAHAMAPPAVAKSPKTDLVLTTASDIEQVKTNQISSTTTGSNKKFKAIDNVLHIAMLYTMATKTRPLPIPTAVNPTGYSEPTFLLQPNGTYAIVPADDLTKWAHDSNRLYQIMIYAFHESTHYICAADFDNRDGLAIYTAMHKHFYGQNEADISRLRKLIQGFKGNPNAEFKADIVRFTALLADLEYAQARPCTEQERLQYLYTAFRTDPRADVGSIFLSCWTNMLSYARTIERVTLYFDFAPPRTVKINALSSKTEVCRKFLAGTCFMGKDCKYYHAPVKTATVDSIPGKGTASPPPAPPGSTPVTAANRTKNKPAKKTPPPPGRQDARTPYLKGNMKLLTNGDTPNPDDPWQNNALLNPSSDRGGVHFNINMFHAQHTPPSTPVLPPQATPLIIETTPLPDHTSIPSTIPPTSIAESPIQSDNIVYPPDTPVTPSRASAWDSPRHWGRPMTHGTPTQDEGGAFQHCWDFIGIPLEPNCTRFQATVAECSKYIIEYYTVVTGNIHQLPLFTEDFVIRYETSSASIHLPAIPIMYLAIFGWISPITLSHCRPDVRDGYPRYMRLIQKMASKLLHATITTPDEPNAEYNPDNFNMFNPAYAEDVFRYHSTMANINHYFLLRTALDQFDMNASDLAIFETMLIYDCMSFLTHCYQQFCLGPNYIWRCLPALRRLLLTDVSTNVSKIMSLDGSKQAFYEAITVVIMHVLPGPYPLAPDSLYHGPDPIAPSERHYRETSILRDYHAFINQTEVDSLRPPKLTIEQWEDMYPEAIPMTKLTFGLPPALTYAPVMGNATRLANHFAEFLCRDPTWTRGTTPWQPPPSAETTRYNSRKRSISFTPDTASSSSRTRRPPLHNGPTSSTPDRLPPPSLNTFWVTNHHARLNSFHVPDRILFDSGASCSGTGHAHRLTSIKPIDSIVNVQAAFGPSMTPTHQGSLGPLELTTLLLPALGDSTLVSVSQFCAGGVTNDHFVGIFTHQDFRMFEVSSILPQLSLIALHGKEVTRGVVQDGLYVESSN